MQRDTHLTFKEIHGSPAALQQSIKTIQELALYRETPSQLCLRFLSLDSRPNVANRVNLRLSPLAPVTRPFIAVSYTWERSDTPPDSVPQYRVITPDEKVIEPNSGLNFVLHRTMEFMKRRTKHVKRIWIDQLCVQQQDPEDVERHLQCMHTVYASSLYTFVPLCCTVDESMLSILDGIENGFHDAERSHTNEVAASILKLLETVTRDRWWTRTWTYQERMFANDLVLSVHSEPSLKGTLLGADTCYDRVVSLRKVKTRVWSLSIRYHTVPDSMKMMDQIGQILNEKLDIYASAGLVGADEFRVLESCDNSVVSDRVAIFANVGDCSYRLESRRLDSEQFSYSTCILVLVAANALGAIAGSHNYVLVRVDATVGAILSDWYTATILDVTAMYADRKAVYFVDSLDVDVDEAYALIPLLDRVELYGSIRQDLGGHTSTT